MQIKDEYLYRHIANQAMLFQMCFTPITSLVHISSCITVGMFDERREFISDHFRPVMTFGLCGCTTMIIAIFDEKYGKCLSVVLAHDPFVSTIIRIFKRYYNCDNYFVVIIKDPNKYIKVNDKWIEEPQHKEYILEHIYQPNVHLHFVPYNTNKQQRASNFMSSLYVVMRNGKGQYSDNYGRMIDIGHDDK